MYNLNTILTAFATLIGVVGGFPTPPKLFITVEINSLDLGSEQRKRHFYEINFCEEMKHNIALQEGAGYAFFNPKELPKVTKIVPFDLAAVTMFVHSRLSRRQITPILD